MNILNLFKKKSRLYAIELDDAKINEEILALIKKINKNMAELQDFINNRDIGSKDVKMSELQNKFSNMKSKVDSLRSDLERIIAIEIQNKEYITVHDDGYLQDKRDRLHRMGLALEDLIDLIMDRPSIEDLRDSLFQEIQGRINFIINSLYIVMEDDEHLKVAYEKLEAF